MSGTPAIMVEVEKAASMIGTARRLLATGAVIDLAALEDMVRHLCAAVEGLATEDGRQYLPRLEALLGSLDALAEALKGQHGRLAGEGPR